MASKDFFLSPDDAQTLGDINYMRKSVRVKHTFPKNLKNPNGFEIVKDVSSSQDMTLDRGMEIANTSIGYKTPKNTSFSSQAGAIKPQQDSNSSSGSTLKNNVGSSMDMFRNMARNLGRR